MRSELPARDEQDLCRVGAVMKFLGGTAIIAGAAIEICAQDAPGTAVMLAGSLLGFAGSLVARSESADSNTAGRSS